METRTWGCSQALYHAPGLCNEKFLIKSVHRSSGQRLVWWFTFICSVGHGRPQEAVKGAMVLGHPTPRSGEVAEGRALSPVRRSRNRYGSLLLRSSFPASIFNPKWTWAWPWLANLGLGFAFASSPQTRRCCTASRIWPLALLL